MPEHNCKFPLIEILIEPGSEKDRSRMPAALASFTQNGPNVFVKFDSQSGDALIGGMSETHLDGIISELKRQDVAVKLGEPQVAYREAITRRLTKDYTHKKSSGGTAAYARVVLEIEPNEKAMGNSFESKFVGVALPDKFIPGVEKGIKTVLESGPLNGFPIVDLKVTLVDGAYHTVDSSVIAFEIATRAALREAFEVAGPVLLEPIMKVEVATPEEFLELVIGDLHSRRGQVIAVKSGGDATTINALVSLANLFGYESKLKSLSKGAASFTTEYSNYQPAGGPPDPDDFPPAVGLRVQLSD